MFKFSFIKVLLVQFIVLQAFACALNPQRMTYEDIVAFNKPQKVILSPSGNKTGYIVRNGHLNENRNIDTLYLYDNISKQQRVLCEADSIIQLSWGMATETLYYLIQDGNQYKIVANTQGGQTVLLRSDDEIAIFSLNPNETSLYYTKTIYHSVESQKNMNENGRVYKWQVDQAFSFKQETPHKEWEEIWKLDFTTGTKEFVFKLPYNGWFDHLGSVIANIEVAQNGQYLLLCVNELGKPELGSVSFTNKIKVLDLKTNQLHTLRKDSIAVQDMPCWVGETQFVFQEIVFHPNHATKTLWLFDIQSQSEKSLGWIQISRPIGHFSWDKSKEMLYGLSDKILYSINLKEQKVQNIELPETLDRSPSIDREGCQIGFISESSNEPPEIAIFNVAEHALTKITNLNPQLANFSLGRVEKFEVQTVNGVSTDGYILHPVNEHPGRKYPLIVCTYGFSGSFITDAEWHSSFPAQTFAGEDYILLLLNNVGTGQDLVGNSELARKIEGWDVLALFEKAVDKLVSRGIADPNKVGIYGWSHGAFIVNFLIAHSNKFQVAALGEGGDYNPSGFWLSGHPIWLNIFINTFGGPPWGDSLKNYLNFCPFYHVENIKSPLLMEYAESVNMGFEMYAPLRWLGVPVELVYYQGEEHNFEKPKARVASMARKLEWFDYWFFDKRNPDSAKKEQYERWDSMRNEAIKKGKI
jgi:dienelactone hydrolase